MKISSENGLGKANKRFPQTEKKNCYTHMKFSVFHPSELELSVDLGWHITAAAATLTCILHFTSEHIACCNISTASEVSLSCLSISYSTQSKRESRMAATTITMTFSFLFLHSHACGTTSLIIMAYIFLQNVKISLTLFSLSPPYCNLLRKRLNTN